MNGWSESLYHELKPLGISVSIVCPGPVANDFSRDFATPSPNRRTKLESFQRSSLAGGDNRVIESRRFEAVLPRRLALIAALRRHLPNLFRALAQRRFRRHVKDSGRRRKNSRPAGTHDADSVSTICS
jgi:short-subunit dehydrogenase